MGLGSRRADPGERFTAGSVPDAFGLQPRPPFAHPTLCPGAQTQLGSLALCLPVGSGHGKLSRSWEETEVGAFMSLRLPPSGPPSLTILSTGSWLRASAPPSLRVVRALPRPASGCCPGFCKEALVLGMRVTIYSFLWSVILSV